MYKKVPPILKPNTTTKVPIHLPKIKPPIRATGDPNPKKGNTHKIVSKKKTTIIRNKFDSLSSIKYELFFFINS